MKLPSKGWIGWISGALALWCSTGMAHGETARAAVAANFTVVAESLAADFTARTGHSIDLSFGATGALYAQVTQAAPFDVLLAADDERPGRAVNEGIGVPGTVFTYAVGRLALYGSAIDGEGALAALESGSFERLAIANKDTAPYGVAAEQVLKALGLESAVAPKIVRGENISQALQFVDSGNAELGFVALSQVVGKGEGAYWLVPEGLHQPILQDAVLLTRGADKPAATAFLGYLRGEAARAIIAAAGYGLP